jgi:FKBP-type peptidyl-prolyl cis-trans isomerase SlyD
MPIKKDQVVTFSYTLKEESGEVLDTATKEEPFSFLSGRNQILPELESNIGNMLIGSKKEVVLSPENAYGEYKKEAIQPANKKDFPPGTEIKPGMSYVADTPDGKHLPFIIKEVNGEDVTLDFNHPLAGKTLTFNVELLNVRDATAEELSHGHIHGAGEHHH